MRFDPSEWEPVISDARLERLVPRLHSAFGRKKLDDAEFVTFIQPAREVTRATEQGIQFRSWVPEMAVFAVLSPRPRSTKPGQRLMSHATVSLSDFREVDKLWSEGNHPVDPAWQLMKIVTGDHVRKLDDLNSLIN